MKRFFCLLLALALLSVGYALSNIPVMNSPGQSAPDGESTDAVGGVSSDSDSAAGVPSQSAPDTELTEVLGGRLRVRLPAGMDSYNHQDDLNIDATSFSFGDIFMLYPYEKPNLYFAELYTLSSGDLKRDAERMSRRKLLYYHYEYEFYEDPIQYENGLEVLVGIPRKFRYHATLQKLVLIKMPDNTLIALLVSTSDDMANRQAELDSALNGILLSIEPGEKPLYLRSHPVVLRADDTMYDATCPEGYVVGTNPQEWSFRYTFTKVNAIDKPEASIDFYPWYYQYTEPDRSLTAEADELFGHPVEWHVYTLDDYSLVRYAAIDFETDSFRARYYIRANYTDEADWDTMRAIFEGISESDFAA